MSILFCGELIDCKHLGEEIWNKLDIKSEYAPEDISGRQLNRIVKRNNLLVVDLDNLTATSVMALAFAYTQDIEVLGFYRNIVEDPIGQMLNDGKSRLMDMCDHIMPIDEVVENIN